MIMKLICLILACSLLFSGCAFAEDNGDDILEITLSGMTLREKVAQMMIVSFRVWQEVPETEDGEQPAETGGKDPADAGPVQSKAAAFPLRTFRISERERCA